ncbi:MULTISPECIES: ChaN family lipoprotein [Glaesserella]|uniref:Iron-regulated lipoprotein n=1 Tax=Glaesserella australis TaxID=2094024 RepID=A0A328C474_9PAST|nr:MULTISPECIES: ChaN family lipoprotein [Glaesserella]AUI66778.1 iron-regulated lipoprotein [Glaesserella sp. 15-184]RAL19830.1 iron-regulated lipoprotein [Glaesserella australis]
MLNFFLRKLILLSLFFIVSCSSSLKDVSVTSLGKIQDLRTGEQLTPQAFVQKIATVPHILLGEQHDNLAHHQAQFWLLQQLQQYRPQGSVLLEMLSVDQQPHIAKVEQNPTAYFNDLPSALHWKKGWEWRFYGESVRYALENKTALVATNLTQQEVSTLMSGAEPIQGNQSTHPDIQKKIAQLILQHHHCDCDVQDPMIQKMVQVQQFRDRRMAEKVLSAKTPNLLIAGNHHINRQIGVAVHLQDLSPQMPHTKVVTILMGSDSKGLSEKDADYIWILN